MTQPTEYKTNFSGEDASSKSHFPRPHLFAAIALSLCLAILLSLVPNEQAEAKRSSMVLDLDSEAALATTRIDGIAESEVEADHHLPTSIDDSEIDNSETVAEIESPVEPEEVWTTQTVKNGDSLSFVFQRAGLSDRELMNFMLVTPEAKALKRIIPGQQLDFLIEDKALKSLRYHKSQLTSIQFNKVNSKFVVEETVLTPEIRQTYKQAVIKESLFLAAQSVDLPAGTTMELAGIFGWDIDFALDIRSNDAFKVLYEEKFLDGKKIGDGKILAAEFSNQGKTFRAVYYEDSKGDAQYYAPNGDAMRKAFLRTPIDFARISSHFNLKRKHPILNTIRAHKGTDYAAPTGTPIKAAGDGKVTWAATKGGYGKTVIIQHGQTYKTLYAHMSKYGRGIKTGKRVKQGQIIGYVGTTGRSTGPHLHYEFHKNGVVRNPVTVKLPKAESVAQSEMARFKSATQITLAALESQSSDLLLAQKKTN